MDWRVSEGRTYPTSGAGSVTDLYYYNALAQRNRAPLT
jgi:hypothetical protein